MIKIIKFFIFLIFSLKISSQLQRHKCKFLCCLLQVFPFIFKPLIISEMLQTSYVLARVNYYILRSVGAGWHHSGSLKSTMMGMLITRRLQTLKVKSFFGCLFRTFLGRSLGFSTFITTPVFYFPEIVLTPKCYCCLKI